jgi:hypothetical protein
VKDDALRVDDWAQGEGSRLARALDDPLGEELSRRRRGFVGEHATALLIQGFPDERGQTGASEPLGLGLAREPSKELVDRRQAP